MLDTFKRSSASWVTAVLPVLRLRPAGQEGPTAGADHRQAGGRSHLARRRRSCVLTMDLHADQIQGFFDVPVDHLFAAPVLLEAVRDLQIPDLVIVSPDAGGVERARGHRQAHGGRAGHRGQGRTCAQRGGGDVRHRRRRGLQCPYWRRRHQGYRRHLDQDRGGAQDHGRQARARRRRARRAVGPGAGAHRRVAPSSRFSSPTPLSLEKKLARSSMLAPALGLGDLLARPSVESMKTALGELAFRSPMEAQTYERDKHPRAAARLVRPQQLGPAAPGRLDPGHRLHGAAPILFPSTSTAALDRAAFRKSVATTPSSCSPSCRTPRQGAARHDPRYAGPSDHARDRPSRFPGRVRDDRARCACRWRSSWPAPRTASRWKAACSTSRTARSTWSACPATSPAGSRPTSRSCTSATTSRRAAFAARRGHPARRARPRPALGDACQGCRGGGRGYGGGRARGGPSRARRTRA